MLYLQSPSGKMKLVNIQEAGRWPFQLSVTAKEAGRFLFEIIELDDEENIISQANFPVQINSADPISVLILNHAPNFESKYLKNWLADQAYAVAVSLYHFSQ